MTDAPLSDRPFWWEDMPPEQSTSRIPKYVDVLIVGGGYTGLTAALYLSRAGRSTAVLEARSIGEGASSRNAGMCGDSLKLGYSDLRKQYGERIALSLCGEVRDALSALKAFIQEEGITCDYQELGRLTGAFDDKQLSDLERGAKELQEKVGIPYEILSKRDVQADLATDKYAGARLLPHHAGLHPAKLVDGVAERVRASGGQICEQTAVLDYEKVSNAFYVKTNRGDCTAKELVFTTNGYIEKKFGTIRRRFVPVASYMITTEELSDNVMAGVFRRQRLVTDTNRLLCYYRPSPDGKRVLFGGRPTYTSLPADESGRRLKAYMASLFPAIAQVRISHSWSGLIAYTFDHLPHMGNLDGVRYAGGYCGSGVVMSHWFGRKLALQVLRDRHGDSAFAEIHHPTHVLYRGTPWFLPLVQAWYQASDKIAWRR